MTTSVVLMSKAAARALTKRIQEAGQEFAELLVEAQDGRAWEVLGYATWVDYCRGEFTVSIRRVNQLLTQGRVNRALAEAGSTVRAESAREAATAAQSIAKGNAFPAVEQEIIERRSAPPITRTAFRDGSSYGPEFDFDEAVLECPHCHKAEPQSRYIVRQQARDDF